MKKSISRRSLLKAASIGLGSQVLLKKAQAQEGAEFESDEKGVPFSTQVAPYMQLASPIQQLWDAKGFDIVVIGSGYGGSVLSARLKAKFPQKTLALLERGKEWKPGDYPKTMARAAAESLVANPLGLYDFQLLSGLDVVSASGLGGTSLMNANVAIEPDQEMWEQPEWPKELLAESRSGRMTEYYRRARHVLQPETYPEGKPGWPVLKKDEVLKEGALATGATYRQVDVTVNFSRTAKDPNAAGQYQAPCTLCAGCVMGCNYGAKNTLNMNYLPLAKKAGAQMFTQVSVEFVRKLSNDSEGYRYGVVFLHRDKDGKVTRGELKTRNVVVSAGVLGTNKIMLRSKANGSMWLSDRVGYRVSSNGDTLGWGMGSKRRTDIKGIDGVPKSQGYPGPTMESAAVYNKSPNLKDRFVIEHSAIPHGLNTPVEVFAATNNTRGVWDVLNHSMLYLGCGHDDANGKLYLEKDGKMNLDWPSLGKQPVFQKIKAAMKAQAEAIGAKFTSPDLRGHPITVHPLGGCVMAESAERGVIDAKGRVFSSNAGTDVHPGFYVADASIMPTAIGVNPFLTITALSERIAEHVEERDL